MKISEKLKHEINYAYEGRGIELSREDSIYIIEKVDELEQNQIVWHKWPDEIPNEIDEFYLVYLSRGKTMYVAKLVEGGNGLDWEEVYEEDVIAWAELPKYTGKE